MPPLTRPVHNVRPERVISEVLMWSRDWKEVRRLAYRSAEIYNLLLEGSAGGAATGGFGGALQPLASGVGGWLGALQRHNVPTSLVTKLPRKQVGGVPFVVCCVCVHGHGGW